MNKIFLLILTISWLIIAGCTSEKDDENHTMEDHHKSHDHHDHESMPKGEVTDMSLYNLTSTWKDQEDNMVQLKDLSGEVQVVAMVYTTCEFACPRIVADMKRIQSALKQKGFDNNVNFVLVSIDPKVDTVERLRQFAKENDMDRDNWLLLNGDESNILELAALLGVKYKKTTEKDYAHSNIITVLNKKGEIAHQQEGLNQDPSKTIEEIEHLIKS